MIKKAVLPVAGFGTRFLPATKAIPKEMLPVVDRPVIHYAVEEAVAAGIEKIILVTAKGKQSIEDYFDHHEVLEQLLERKGAHATLDEVRKTTAMAQVVAIRQKKQLGLGHAVLVTEPVVGREPFAVILPDDLILAEKPVLSQMMEVFEKFRVSVIAVEQVPRERISAYGVIKGEAVEDGIYRVEDLVEKPRPEEAPSDLAIIGRYILTPEIFDCLKETPPGRGGEIQLTDAIKRLAEKQPVYAFKFSGRRFDTGNKLGFLKANIAFGLAREELKEELRKFIENEVQNLSHNS